MDRIQIDFDKEKTGIIKGVAIIFMIVLHVFGGAGWYEDRYDLPMNNNEILIHFMGALQICVGIFTFMIGFGYAFSKKKDFAYSIHHTKQLLHVFWTVLFLFALPAGYCAIGGGKSLILNMFGIDETLSWVSWFVFLYIWAMIVMPFIGRLIDRKPFVYSILSALASWGGMVAVHYFVPGFGKSELYRTLFTCLGWTPTIILGYLFAKQGLFRQLSIPNHPFVSIVAVILILFVLWAKSVFHGISILNFDILYATIIITCILVIFSQMRLKWIRKILIELGDKSVYMWFIHALFFTAATRPVYQQLVMISDNLWLIAIWTIIISYMCAFLLKKLTDI